MIAIDKDITPQDMQNVAPVGGVIMYAGATAPDDWMICDGSLLLRSAYPDLFTAIGTAFGGDSTHFSLPDLRGRVPAGYHSTELEFSILGEPGGEKTHLLTANESGLLAHTHSQSGASAAGGGIYLASAAGTGYSTTTGSSGSQSAILAHNNLQPYLTLNFIIRYRYGAPI